MNKQETLWSSLGIQMFPRAGKPRNNGLTCLIDLTEPTSYYRELLENYGEYIDLIKLHNCRLYSPRDKVAELIRMIREYDVDVEPSGVILEIARIQGRELEVLGQLRKIGYTHVEVSASAGDTPEMQKQVSFADQARKLGFNVIGEVGKKFPQGDKTLKQEGQIDVSETINEMQAYLDAGVDKIYWEASVLAKVIGSTGPQQTEKRKNALEQIKPVVEKIGKDHIIFEVPAHHERGITELFFGWFVREIGSDVNIGNCPPSETSFLEGIRRGVKPVFEAGQAGDHPWVKSIATGGSPTSPWAR